MRVLLLMALLALPASAPSAPLFSTPAAPEPAISIAVPDRSVIDPNPSFTLGVWPPTAAQMAADRARKNGGRALFHKLTELPPANEYVAVFRHDGNGCEAPIVVKYGVGHQ